jgi:hypothetical protein
VLAFVFASQPRPKAPIRSAMMMSGKKIQTARSTRHHLR